MNGQAPLSQSDSRATTPSPGIISIRKERRTNGRPTLATRVRCIAAGHPAQPSPTTLCRPAEHRSGARVVTVGDLLWASCWAARGSGCGSSATDSSCPVAGGTWSSSVVGVPRLVSFGPEQGWRLGCVCAGIHSSRPGAPELRSFGATSWSLSPPARTERHPSTRGGTGGVTSDRRSR
jgi:hypothetical protein